MTTEQRYPSDLSDKEWALIADFMKPDPAGGRPPKYSRRDILNAIFYVAKTGCQWRYLPKNLPPWKAVYMQFLRWRNNGKIEQIYDALHKRLRTSLGKDTSPSVGIIDSQSIKTTEKRGSPALMQGKK
jgi:putative transposase